MNNVLDVIPVLLAVLQVIYVDDDGNPVIFQGQDGPTRASNLERNSENLYVVSGRRLVVGSILHGGPIELL